MSTAREPSAPSSYGELVFSGLIGAILAGVGVYGCWAKDLQLSEKNGQMVHFSGHAAVIAGAWLIYFGSGIAALPFRKHRRFTIPILFVAGLLLIGIPIFF